MPNIHLNCTACTPEKQSLKQMDSFHERRQSKEINPSSNPVHEQTKRQKQEKKRNGRFHDALNPPTLDPKNEFLHHHFSQPTVDLIDNSIPRKLTPIPTTLRHRPRNRHFLDILGSFEDTDVQAGADMPSDVAMERPDAWIVLIDLEDDVSRGVGVFGRLHPDGVAALGVAGVGDGVGVFAEALGEDVPVGRRGC